MAVARMRKVTILALKELETPILEKLRDLEIMQITKAQPLLEDSSEKEVQRQEPEIPEEWTRRLSQLSFIRSYYLRYNMPKKGFIDMFTGKKPQVSQQELYDLASRYDIEGTFNVLTAHDSRLKEIGKEISDIDSKIDMLSPWEPLDISLDYLGPTAACENVLTVIPSGEASKLIQSLPGPCVYQIIFQEKSYTGFWILVTKEEFASLSASISGVGGSLLDLKRIRDIVSTLRDEPVSKGKSLKDRATVKEVLEGLRQIRKAFIEEMEKIKAADTQKSQELIPVMALLDYYTDKKNLREKEKEFTKTRFTFVIEGFVRAKDIDKLRNSFSREEDVEIFDEEPGPSDEVPIYLENNPIIRPFEVITNIFGYPHYNEIDPTPILAPFFWLFFGICLADAVYGIVLSLGCWYFLKTQKLGDGGKKLVTLLLYSGVSTFLMGVLMGSWMGDLPSVFFKGSIIEKAVLKMTILNPIEDPLTLLAVSFALGIFQIWVGIIVKMVSSVRSGNVYEAIISQGSWVVFLPGLIGFALSKAGLIQSNIPLYIAAIGAFMVMYANSRGQKNILLKPFSGLYGLYGTIGYFSDTMSYARLLALGLASAVIAVVINKIAQLVASMIPIVGWVLVPFILLGGHVFNLVINVLGSFIHSGRLQFVEFFTKFFEGGGKPFKPLTRVEELVSID